MVAISQPLLKSHWVIVLCGGRGSRLDSVTESIPKSLALVHDKPIIWYTFLTLFNYGFRKFIFPLGYRGEMIEEFVTKEFDELGCEIRFLETGLDTPIAQRLQKVSSQIDDGDDFHDILSFEIKSLETVSTLSHPAMATLYRRLSCC